MLPAGFSNLSDFGEFAGSNLVLAVRNTFITLLDSEGPQEAKRGVRSSSCPASVCGEDESMADFGDVAGGGAYTHVETDWEDEEKEDEEEDIDDVRDSLAIKAEKGRTFPVFAGLQGELPTGDDSFDVGLCKGRKSFDFDSPFNTDMSTDVPRDDAFDDDEDESDFQITPISTLRSAGGGRRRPAPASLLPADGSTVPRPPIGVVFQQEVFAMVEEVAGVLRHLECCAQAEVRMESSSSDQGVCTLVATVIPERLHTVEQLTQAAKEAVYSRTSRSRGVCLIGFKKMPFTPTPEGFTAQFGTVSPKRQACRQLYTDGRCKYMESCFWRHPVSLVSLNFVVADPYQQSFLTSAAAMTESLGEFLGSSLMGGLGWRPH